MALRWPLVNEVCNPGRLLRHTFDIGRVCAQCVL
jgi:hypothetical protein